MNEILKNVVTIKLMTCVLAQAVGLTTLVQLASHFDADDSVAIVTFSLMIVLVSVNILGIGGGMAAIFSDSSRALIALKKLNEQVGSIKNSRKLRKGAYLFWQSCTLIRVKMGSANHMDSLTPLVFIDFANNLTVNFLLF